MDVQIPHYVAEESTSEIAGKISIILYLQTCVGVIWLIIDVMVYTCMCSGMYTYISQLIHCRLSDCHETIAIQMTGLKSKLPKPDVFELGSAH